MAGPVKDGRCTATNLPWAIDERELSRVSHIPHLWLINDLEANAWGLRFLRSDELFVLNEGMALTGNAALISAGTGLGEAGIFWDGHKHIPFACEGGHADFSIRNEQEVELWRYLRRKFQRISYERVLSGPGIYRIYRFFVDTGLEEADPEVEVLGELNEPQRMITEKALARSSKVCIRTMELFASIYGGEAGNLALKMFAINGIYVGGGIAPKIVDILKNGSFLKSFMNKGRFKELLSQVPIKVLLNDYTALLGAARYAQEKK